MSFNKGSSNCRKAIPHYVKQAAAILLLEYVIPPLLRRQKTDLIVDHKNDAVSCKFNRSVHIVMEM